MRNEEEMMKLILDFANNDKRIRAAIMNGSRVNPRIKKDIFQDYDIVYFVTDVEPFKNDEIMINHFGDIMLMQKPEDKILPPALNDGRYIRLMQFFDGNRIDMQIMHISQVSEVINDSLTKVLLDKDQLIPPLDQPDERDYLVTRPTQKLYEDVCDSFIWGVGSHIPKTIWRKEIILLKQLIEIVLREPLLEMIKWKVGIKTDFQVSIGKGGKKLDQFLSQQEWQAYLDTYADANYDNIWNSLDAFYQVFKDTALFVGKTCGYPVPLDQLKKAYDFLLHVKQLPQDAKSIY